MALQRGCKKNLIFATFGLAGKLYTLFFEKRRVFPFGFTFNIASPCENTDAVNSDNGMSTSEEKIDSESESSGGGGNFFIS